MRKASWAQSSWTTRRWRTCGRAEWRARLAGAFQDFFRFGFSRQADSRFGRRPATGRRARRGRGCRPRRRRRHCRPSSFGPRYARWRAASCAMNCSCWSSTNRPLHWTRRLNTRCSSATPLRRAAAARTEGVASRSSSPIGSPRSAWPILWSFSMGPDWWSNSVRRGRVASSYRSASGRSSVGTHDDLMAKKGHYSELYSIQAAAYR